MNYVLGSRASIGGVLGQGRGGAAAQWWLSGGVDLSNCICAYQPIGAASLAASYSNLANPGTYDAAPGVAPTWAAATGWTFNNSAWLTTGITPGLAYSALVQFSDVVDDPLIFTTGFYLIPNNVGFSLTSVWSNGGQYSQLVTYSAGNMAIAGPAAYYNGSLVAAIPTGTAPSGGLLIGRNTANSRFLNGKIQAIAIYNTTLSAAQVAAISAAMAAL